MTEITTPLQKGYYQAKERLYGNPKVNIDLAWEKSGLPESYKNRFYANPYFGKTASGGFLGINQKSDQMKLDIESDKYIATLLEQAYKEQYESPVQAAARERAAGINPDLAGLSEAGQASDANSTPTGTPDLSNPMEHIQSFAGFLINLASFTAAIPKEVQAVKAASLANDAQAIANAGMLEDLVIPHTADFGFVDDSETEGKPDKNGYYDTEGQAILAARLEDDEEIDNLLKSIFGDGNDKRTTKLIEQAKRIYKANRNTTKSRIARKELSTADHNADTALDTAIDADHLAKVTMQYQINSMELALRTQLRLAEWDAKNAGKLTGQLDNQLDMQIEQTHAATLQAEAAGAQARFNAGFYNARRPSYAAEAANTADKNSSRTGILESYRIDQMELDYQTLQQLGNWYGTQESKPTLFTDRWWSQWVRPQWNGRRKWYNRQYEEAYKRFWGREYGSNEDGFQVGIPGIGNFGIKY